MTATITEAEAEAAEGVILKLVQHNKVLMDEHEQTMLDILGRRLPFSNIVSIQGWKEFDFLEWDFEQHSVRLKVRPKGHDISFWHTYLDDVIMKPQARKNK